MSAPPPAGGAGRPAPAPALAPEIRVSDEYRHLNAEKIRDMLKMQHALENFKADGHKDKDPTSVYHFTNPGLEVFNACMAYQKANTPKHNLMITQGVLEMIPNLIKLLESRAFETLMNEMPGIIETLQSSESFRRDPEKLTDKLLVDSQLIRTVSKGDMKECMKDLNLGFGQLKGIHKYADKPFPEILLDIEQNPFLLGTTLKYAGLFGTRKALKEALVENKKKTVASGERSTKRPRVAGRAGEAGAAGGAGGAGEAGAAGGAGGAGEAGAAGGAGGDEDIEDSPEIDLNPCAGTAIGASLKNHRITGGAKVTPTDSA